MKHLHIADVAAPQPPADLSVWADLVDQMAADAAGLNARLDVMLGEPRHRADTLPDSSPLGVAGRHCAGGVL